MSLIMTVIFFLFYPYFVHCLGPLMRAFQFHSQTLVGPLLSVWSDLTGTEDLKESSSR